jgi:hypothetical protein
MYIVRLTCNHCGTENVVAECKCEKPYVITTAHIEGRLRDDAAGSVGHMQAVLVGHTCDACIAQYFGGVEDAAERQRTCPVCHNEFLSHHGY